MAAKAFDPTANPFELLASAESQQVQDAAVRTKKPAARKLEDEASTPAGGRATPAEKAKLRQAKEAAKAKTQDSSPSTANNQDKETPKKKLTREQFLEEKKKGNIVDANEQLDARPPRARGDQSPAQANFSDRSRGGGSGGRGRGRGNRGGDHPRGRGRGRGGDGDKSGRALGDREHHHQPPAHGREYDKKSGMKTGRHPVTKKGGAGGANWGTDKDELAGQTGTDNVEAPVDDVESKTQDSGSEKREPREHRERRGDREYRGRDNFRQEEEEEEEEVGELYEEYIKKREKDLAALTAKLSEHGSAPAAPRKVEAPSDLDKYQESPHAAKASEKKKDAAPTAADKKKMVAAEDLGFRTPPPPSMRGRGRGRGRGGDRGRGRGGDRTDAGNQGAPKTEGGDQQPAPQGGDQQPAQPQQREQRNDQRNDQREQRNDQRGGRGGGRGGRGRGGRGGRGRNLDSNDTRNFPDLGSN